MMQTRSRSESRHRDDAPSSIKPPHPSMHTRQTPSNSGGTFMNSNDDASPSQQPHASVHDDQSHVTEHPSLLTIQIPSGTQIQQQHEPPSTNTEQDRNRSSTFGSEFDLSWAKERGMSISCLLTPQGGDEEDRPLPHDMGAKMGNEEGTNATVSTSSTASGGLLPMTQSVIMHPMPSLMEKGIMDTDGTLQKMQQKQMVSHTPPSHVATSYEQRHFQKRMRAGSISGRLRSASDLEDIGIISNDQKAILKDLLIAGNDQVQAAIDKYEAGDSSTLEQMINSGAFSKSVDVDLLGDLDLDLDFLNVHGDDELVFGMEADITGHDGQGHRGLGQKRLGKILGSDARGDAFDTNRMRTNSLALPGMILEGANQDYSLGDFGQWMDSDLPNLMNPSSKQTPASSDAHVIHADDTSNSFKLQCDLLMQREGDHDYSSMLFDEKPRAKKKQQSSPHLTKKDRDKKSKSKKSDSTDGKKSKKYSSSNEAYSTNTIPFIKREKGADDDEEDNKEVPSGLGRPRSMSDPNLNVRLDDQGLLHVEGPKGWVGAYSPDSRELRIQKFLEKRNHRVWVKKVKYDVRKNFADSRLRVKGRFVKKEDEMLMRELMSLT